jgi:multiple sugar transport system ATP-binding protein
MADVTLRKVVKRYDEVEAVRGIDLDIADHEFVVLVGPSGCGKSTTLRMIAGRRRTAISRWCSRTTRSTRT